MEVGCQGQEQGKAGGTRAFQPDEGKTRTKEGGAYRWYCSGNNTKTTPVNPWKHKGHCVVMDSAYMGDAMCQVGREEWGINMVGTVQSSRTGGGRLGKQAKRTRKLKRTHTNLSSINTTPSHYLMLFG